MNRIDGSHYPFKRKDTAGPGPKHRPRIKQTGTWKCERPTAGTAKGKFYVQLCKNTDTGAVRKVRRDKAKKAKYNKLYRKWLGGERVTPDRKRPGYKCRRTRVSPCT